MPNFDSGVASYKRGYAVIEVFFPVDDRGREDVRCDQCPYYGRTGKICQLNKELVHYPEKYIGRSCPLKFDGEEEDYV